ncbi:hypothetical protein AAMO2058_000580100 [Amorphochlora amoebiformis]|eukprot:1359850-Amorphochlora_amoeboformis.AAC.1
MVHDNPSPQDEKIKRRLARKAELARQSRRRKKAYVYNLECKIEELTAKVVELQTQKEKNSNSVALALCAMAELQDPAGIVSNDDKTFSRTSESKQEYSTSDSDYSGTTPPPPHVGSSCKGIQIKVNHMGDLRTLLFMPEEFTFDRFKIAVYNEFYPFSRTTNKANIITWYEDDEDDPVLITSTPELWEGQRLAQEEEFEQELLVPVKPRKKKHWHINVSFPSPDKKNESTTKINRKKDIRSSVKVSRPKRGNGKIAFAPTVHQPQRQKRRRVH